MVSAQAVLSTSPIRSIVATSIERHTLLWKMIVFFALYGCNHIYFKLLISGNEYPSCNVTKTCHVGVSQSRRVRPRMDVQTRASIYLQFHAGNLVPRPFHGRERPFCEKFLQYLILCSSKQNTELDVMHVVPESLANQVLLRITVK